MSALKVQSKRRRRTTRISVQNQVTLPVEALHKAGLRAGNELLVEGIGPGKLVLSGTDDPVEKLAGMFTGMYPKGYLKKLRREWRA